MALSKDEQVEMYRKMLLIRYFEEKAVAMYGRGMIGGSLHLYTGQEAVAVGACAAINDDDYITSTHRGHGHCLAKGGEAHRMMAELIGKEAGYCRGRGGSMHIADMDRGILGANGIVGGGIPIAAGAALGSKMLKNGRVTLCFFGDGASHGGGFHEALNMAGVWRLPVIFICENNLYALSVPFKRSTLIADIADRAASYGFPGVIVDGNDVIAVHDTVSEAVERARKGEGPTLIEAKTYRWRGHFVGDPCPYRSDEEVERWKKKDPVARFRAKLAEEALMTAEEAKQVDDRARRTIDDAEKFAMEAPDPDPASVMDDVYV